MWVQQWARKGHVGFAISRIRINGITVEITCFGIHFIAISRGLPEIKYSNVHICRVLNNVPKPKPKVGEICNKTFGYMYSYFEIRLMEHTQRFSMH